MAEDRTREAVALFLRTDPTDVGCEATMRVMAIYAERVASGEDPESEFPGVTAHLQSCPPCGTDFAGLMAALEADQPGARRSLVRRPLGRP